MEEKCIRKQIKKLCENYSKHTGTEFINYYDPDFLKSSIGKINSLKFSSTINSA